MISKDRCLLLSGLMDENVGLLVLVYSWAGRSTASSLVGDCTSQIQLSWIKFEHLPWIMVHGKTYECFRIGT